MISSSNIVRSEILPGLPGEGPVPKYFRSGNPTPWAEGVVVRFWNDDGTEWVGNFQPAWSGINRVSLWPQAHSAAVIAGGNFYLLDAGKPDFYRTLEPNANGCATEIAFDEDHRMLFVAGGYALYAFDRERRLVWEKGPGGEIVRLLNCVDGVLTVEIELEMGEPLETVQILATEESIADRRYLDVLFGVLQTIPEVSSIGPAYPILKFKPSSGNSNSVFLLI